jgi:hypothetical protein
MVGVHVGEGVIEAVKMGVNKSVGVGEDGFSNRLSVAVAVGVGVAVASRASLPNWNTTRPMQ